MPKNEESAGEDLIADFLEENAITFKRYPIVPNLTEDNKLYREADFYLPEYKVYVEFLGQWNNPEHQSRYRQKMAVYSKHKIACVYLWPDNLGTLEWMLRRRIREVLLRYNKWGILLKYEWENYTKEYGFILLGIGAIIYFVKNTWWRVGISLYLILTLYLSVSKYIKRLRKIRASKWGSDIRNKNEYQPDLK